MERLEIRVDHSPTVIVENANGNLRIKGWSQNEVRADADGKNSLTHEKDGDTITLICNRDCYLRVPSDSNIVVQNVAGEMFAKSIDGEIEINQTGGNLIMKDIGNVVLQNVGGNLSINRCEGNIEVTNVGGNADLKDVEGKSTLLQIGGNFSMRGETEGLDVEANGNVLLKLETDPDGNYDVRAGGNLECRLSEDTSAIVGIQSESGKIRVKSPDFVGVIKEEDYNLTIGDGETKVELSAGGEVYFRTYSEVSGMKMEFEYELGDDFTGFAEGITDQVTSQIEEQMGALNEQLSSLKLGSMLQGTARAQAAARRAERKIESAQRRLERRAEAAGRRGERRFEERTYRKVHKGKSGFVRFASGFNENEAVGDDERRMVLEMVQNNKISVEDAETLLAAMEGRASETPMPPTPPEQPDLPKMPDLPEKPAKPNILDLQEKPEAPKSPSAKAKVKPVNAVKKTTKAKTAKKDKKGAKK